MKARFRRLACTCAAGASALLVAAEGYNLVEVQQGATSTEIQVAFGPKIPTEAAAKDSHNWSVRDFDLKKGGTGTDIDVTAVDFDVAQKIAVLTLARGIDLSADKLVVTFLQANFPNATSSDPPKAGASKKFAAAKGSADADIYVSGSVTAAEGARPAYAVQSKLGYLFGLGTDGRLGSLGPSSDFALNQSASANPNHIKAGVSYEKFFPMATSAGWLFRSNFIGGEFDQKRTTRNLVSDFSMKFVLPSAHLDTHTFVTMDCLFGYEGGKNYRSPKGVALGSFDRKVLGATGYYLLLHPGPFDRITLTGDYSVRLPSIAEPFVPASGANAILTTKPRHHAAVDLNVMLSKAFGITAQYRWGSLPPLFQFVNHSVVVGLVLQLKQAN